MKIIVTYVILALFATAGNIVTQELVARIYTGVFNILISIGVGTSVGLIIKYILDKRYIFHFHARGTAHDVKIFILYMFMGLITTMIFWGFELGFDYIFKTKEMRYLGAVIGLAIGYLSKYHLDKRYVFRKTGATQ